MLGQVDCCWLVRYWQYGSNKGLELSIRTIFAISISNFGKAGLQQFSHLNISTSQHLRADVLLLMHQLYLVSEA